MDDRNDMSPAEFHRQPGVADWRVTSWGPQACFRVATLEQGSRLVAAVVDSATAHGVKPDIDLREEAVIIRVHHRGSGRIARGVPGFAAAVSESASELDFESAPEMIQTVDISVAQSGVDSRPFWAAALGYEVQGDYDAVDPLRRGPSLSFQDIERTGRGRTHIDVSVPADRAVARVEAALAAGGRLVDDSRAPMWWTIASPDNHGIDIAAWTDTFE